jgi:hypothetical protein
MAFPKRLIIHERFAERNVSQYLHRLARDGDAGEPLAPEGLFALILMGSGVMT